MTEIRLPELTGGSEQEQLRQIRTYLFTLAEQLQFALDSVNREQETVRLEIRSTEKREQTPAQTFSAMKALIIKSADIVESYSQEVERRLEGVYVAQSQFGTFQQETQQRILENAEEIRQEFQNIQSIESRIEDVQSAVLAVNACIKTGHLYDREDSTPVYGVEIGQQVEWDGVVSFRKFARLTSDRLSFYDSMDTEVAYISDEKLHITEANIHLLEAEETRVRKLMMGDYCWSLSSDGRLTLS